MTITLTFNTDGTPAGPTNVKFPVAWVFLEDGTPLVAGGQINSALLGNSVAVLDADRKIVVDNLPGRVVLRSTVTSRILEADLPTLAVLKDGGTLKIKTTDLPTIILPVTQLRLADGTTPFLDAGFIRDSLLAGNVARLVGGKLAVGNLPDGVAMLTEGKLAVGMMPARVVLKGELSNKIQASDLPDTVAMLTGGKLAVSTMPTRVVLKDSLTNQINPADLPPVEVPTPTAMPLPRSETDADTALAGFTDGVVWFYEAGGLHARVKIDGAAFTVTPMI